MTKSCFSFIKQGWFGLPLFFLGLVSLAFSQLEESKDIKKLSADEIAASISSKISKSEKLLNVAREDFQSSLESGISTFESKLSSSDINAEDAGVLGVQFNNLKSRYQERKTSLGQSIEKTANRVSDAKDIFSDLNNNFAGRLEETRPALLALNDNLEGALVELEALSTMTSGLRKDFSYELSSLNEQIDTKFVQNPPSPPDQTRKVQPTTSLGRKISSVIQAREALPLRNSNRIGEKAQLSSNQFGNLSPNSNIDDDDVIARLRKELDDSKSFQTELSADSAELKSDLRKAYREIVSLQTNIKESQMIIKELENSKQSLYRNTDGGPATAQTVSREINRLERELEQAREDLRQSRQSLLLEQQRSNAMISSITTELERTRRELDYSRQMAHASGANFERLAYLERELAQTKRALESAQAQPIEPGTEEFVNLQEELRKSLGEIARMQIELSEKDMLQDELLRLKSTMEQMEETPSRSASPAFVNKLLIELNAANTEIERLQKGSLDEREGLSADVLTLQDQLQATQTELEQVRREFANTKEDIAKREFEFATTIKKLEEEAQSAESVLQQAAEGKMPMVPFVTEMEEDLAASESRIRLLSDQFANEQKRASEVIEELSQELELAQARNKQALDQLSRRELELTNKDQEVTTLAQQKKDLEEELEVVKVIAGQLQDLNQVLEDTKETQSVQTQTSDQIVGSLKDELNRAKIELVVALEEKEKMQDNFSDRLNNLEMQLEDARNEMFEEQEIFQETTSESKILVSELKTELEAARAEIAQMKSSGISESLETKEAVAQLQEALGTIRILQESLQEAEAANLEVDNLRSELADTMTGQLAKFEDVENEKRVLLDQVQNLEAEIALLRQTNSDSQVARLRNSSDLQAKLKSSEAEIEILRKQLSQSEEIGVGSLVQIEDELAVLKNENNVLKSALQSNLATDKVTIEALQNELTLAKSELNEIGVSSLVELEDELAILKNENNELKFALQSASSKDNDNVEALENELVLVKSKLEELENIKLYDQLPQDESSATTQSSTEDPSMIQKAMDLEMKLEMALAKIEQMEGKQLLPNNNNVNLLEQELAQANRTIDELNNQIENMISKQAEAELELAMLENASAPAEDEGMSIDEKAIFIEEINALKEELKEAKEEYASTSTRAPEMTELQEELRQAVAESFQLQMELEQTQDRLKRFEELAELDPSQENIDEITKRANIAQEKAQSRINELTNALRNSEQLRADTEDLVTALEQRVSNGNDISNDPRFVELQQEMLALQSDLISLQEMTDPRVQELEEKLQNSKNEGLRLNSELQGVINEFSNLKTSLNSLEDENRRLREVSLSNARNQADEVGESMQRKINNLSRENANLTNQVADKDTRIDGLRDELAKLSIKGTDNSARNQLLQLQMQLQEAEDTSSQANMETQRLREELKFANRSLVTLQSRMSEIENTASKVGSTSITAAQLSEIEELKSQNNLLKDQLAAMSSVPGRDALEGRIKELNQRNLALTVELDQERIIIDDLKDELSNARSIKQEVLERGKATKLKSDLLNEELSDAKIRIKSLEKALIASREAIRVLQGGGNRGSMIQVSNPSNFSPNLGMQNPRNRPFTEPVYSSSRRGSLPEYAPVRPRNILPSVSNALSVKNDDGGNANLKIQAKVQFLDNKVRPAGFTEFFLVDRDLSTILSEEGIRPPTQEGIQSHAEYWARSVQRGYQFPGIAAKIRNALARASLRRIKTNSLGVGNVDALSDGNYFIIGASTLGQVGVVWSSPVNLNNGDNIISLDLKDAAWAQ